MDIHYCIMLNWYFHQYFKWSSWYLRLAMLWNSIKRCSIELHGQVSICDLLCCEVPSNEMIKLVFVTCYAVKFHRTSWSNWYLRLATLQNSIKLLIKIQKRIVHFIQFVWLVATHIVFRWINGPTRSWVVILYTFWCRLYALEHLIIRYITCIKCFLR